MINLQELILLAGQEIRKIYDSQDYTVQSKDDDSPLTTADLASNRIINEAIAKQGFPVLSEENSEVPYAERKDWKEFFLVDPLDGTKEFLKGNGEFTVNIARIINGELIEGAVYAPVADTLYWGLRGSGSFRVDNASRIFEDPDHFNSARELPLETPREVVYRVVASKSHFTGETKNYIQGLDLMGRNLELINRGSSLKFCLMAEGSADLYPRLGTTMEWDTAAGHAIAKFAGCRIRAYGKDEELQYNKENLMNPWFVVSRER